MFTIDGEHNRAHALPEHGDEHERQREDRKSLHHVRNAQAEGGSAPLESAAAFPQSDIGAENRADERRETGRDHRDRQIDPRRRHNPAQHIETRRVGSHRTAEARWD
jgi:hypothetical protein